MSLVCVLLVRNVDLSQTWVTISCDFQDVTTSMCLCFVISKWRTIIPASKVIVKMK